MASRTLNSDTIVSREGSSFHDYPEQAAEDLEVKRVDRIPRIERPHEREKEKGEQTVFRLGGQSRPKPSFLALLLLSIV